MLRAYFDDSGTHRQSDSVLWGGLIGFADQWDHFEGAWRVALATPRDGLTAPYYHRNEVLNANIGFLGWKRPALDNLTYELRRAILDSGLHGFAAGTFKAIWGAEVQPPFVKLFGSPEFFCFSECIRWAREWSAANAGGAQVSLFFNSDRQEHAIREARHLQDCVHGGLGEVTFLPIKKNPGIQAADMVVGEIGRDMKNWRQHGDGRQLGVHLKPLIESGRFSAGLVDEKIIRSWKQLFALGLAPDLPSGLPPP